MIVEFKHVRSSTKESHEKAILIDLNGSNSVPFENEFDYIASYFLELDDVIDFVGGKIQYNEQELECVYIRLSEEYTCNILFSPEDFKLLLEKTRNIKIRTADEILNE